MFSRLLLYQGHKASGVAINAIYLRMLLVLTLVLFSSLPIFTYTLLLRSSYCYLPYFLLFLDPPVPVCGMQPGLALCEKPQDLAGHVEGDGHILRKIYVSNAKNQESWVRELALQS